MRILRAGGNHDSIQLDTTPTDFGDIFYIFGKLSLVYIVVGLRQLILSYAFTSRKLFVM